MLKNIPTVYCPRCGRPRRYLLASPHSNCRQCYLELAVQHRAEKAQYKAEVAKRRQRRRVMSPLGKSSLRFFKGFAVTSEIKHSHE
jgi:hypothetical protein